MEVVLNNTLSMSIDQYASKVVEKCVKIASKKDLYKFVEIILAKVGTKKYVYYLTSSRSSILLMMNNQFGNYVIQNVLSVAESNQRDQCVRIITPHLSILRASKYGQRVASLCEKYLRGGNTTKF